MQKFTIHTGIAAPLLRDNIDTDAIIPSREMKRVSKLGLGDGLFAVWRYSNVDTRQTNPDFVLNQNAYTNTSIILGGRNFGCGSSREHAVWALKDYGIRSIVASSFGSIFARNCVRNGILPVEIEADKITQLAGVIQQDPQKMRITINLIEQIVSLGEEIQCSFNINNNEKNMLLEGLDQISLTHQLQDQIDAFLEKDQIARPWVYISKPLD